MPFHIHIGAANHTLNDAANYALSPVPGIQVDATTLDKISIQIR